VLPPPTTENSALFMAPSLMMLMTVLMPIFLELRREELGRRDRRLVGLAGPQTQRDGLAVFAFAHAVAVSVAVARRVEQLVGLGDVEAVGDVGRRCVVVVERRLARCRGA